MTSIATPAWRSAIAQLFLKRWDVMRRPLSEGHWAAALRTAKRSRKVTPS